MISRTKYFKCSFIASSLEKNVSSDFFREVGSVWEFLTLSGRLFHIAGAYDLVALPPNRIVFKSLGFGKTRRDCSCCLLFVLNDGTSPRQIPVHVFMSFANKYPCILVSTRKPTLTHLVSVNLAEWRKISYFWASYLTLSVAWPISGRIGIHHQIQIRRPIHSSFYVGRGFRKMTLNGPWREKWECQNYVSR